MKVEAIALCRVSTSKQRIEGSSLEAQELRVYEAANYLEADLVRVWSVDVSSRKGKNVKRPDLLEMFDFCKQNKKIRYLIVDEVDRFMRSVKEYYYWKVQFETINVQLRHANHPEVDPEDPRAVFDELIDIYRAEQSNQERINKTPEKMQSKIIVGYYPGMVKQGYQKSEIKGLHVRREPQWSLLREVMRKILYEAMTLHEALKWLDINGYRMVGGGKLHMDKFKSILKDGFYAGIVKMSTWDVINEHGLHEAMITKDEHEKLKQIVLSKGKKFTVRKENPHFPMNNIGLCPECYNKHGKRAALVGYTHNNGKGNSYDRYRCRVCNKAILRKKVHDGIDEFLDQVEFIHYETNNLSMSLKRVYKEEIENNTQQVARFKQKLRLLKNEKNNLIRTMSQQSDLASDIKETVQELKHEINNIENDIEKAEEIDKDFEEFIDFALDFVNNLKDEFWNLEEWINKCVNSLFFRVKFL